MIGKTLGHYEIIEPLGAGGMGEVYRAHDTNLKRDVAIKVLPEDLAADQERLARLEREAHLLAALNHPNIASIYSLEESDGTRFLVLELAEGQTLDKQLASGRLDVEEALEVAKQIALALEAAHEQGIIHRDLKPSNVTVTDDGKVKVLDFGLAKAFEVEGEAEGDLSRSPTITVEGTRTGVIMGTAAYMSPEQAKGKPLDKRTDIFSFGCVLYEMLTGQRPFVGEDVSETLAAILKDEPDWTALPANTPLTATALLRRCLRKDPERRLHDIADARIEIEEALGEPTVPSVGPMVRQPPGWRRAIPWVIAGLFATVAIFVTFWSLNRSTPSAPRPVSHFLIDVEPGQQLWGHRAERADFGLQRPTRTAMAFSPDGSYLVYAATADDTRGREEYVQRAQLYLRWIDQPRARPIPGTERGRSPFISSDGEWVGFYVYRLGGGHEIKKVAVAGGEPQTIVDEALPPYGASWADNGTILFADGASGGLLQVAATGGSPPEHVTRVDRGRGETSHRLPQMLPGGGTVLFTIAKGRSWDRAEIALQSFGSDEHSVLIEDGADARYIPTGHLVFVRRGTLMAVPFDLESLEVTGESVRVVEDVMQAAFSSGAGHNTLAGQFSISGSGSLAYVPGGIHPGVERSLAWVDREGNAEDLAAPLDEYRNPRLSPDGQQLAYAEGQLGAMDVWVYDVQRQTERRLTFEGENWAPVWSPDGTRIAFSSTRDGPVPNLYWMAADGTEQERLTTSDRPQLASSWSVKGVLAFVQGYNERADIWVLALDEERELRAFVETRFSELYPAFSPDGEWLAYSSDETGQDEVYVKPYPGPGRSRRVSTEGGIIPAWSKDGREILYRVRDSLGGYSRMMVVEVVADQTFTAGRPRLLFEELFAATSAVRSYDVTRSGQFVMVTRGEPELQPVTQINIVQNFFEELKRLVPTER